MLCCVYAYIYAVSIFATAAYSDLNEEKETVKRQQFVSQGHSSLSCFVAVQYSDYSSDCCSDCCRSQHLLDRELCDSIKFFLQVLLFVY